MENTVELYIDINVKNVSHRITIKHGDYPCDAEIYADDVKIQVHPKVMSIGGAFKFEIDGVEVIITILSSKDDFIYDCFVDGVSVQNDMPWQIDSMSFPKSFNWERQRKSGKSLFIISEIIKGVLIGCCIFFVLWFIARFDVIKDFPISWIHLVISIVPLVLVYSILSPLEWNKNEKSYEKFKNYQNVVPVYAEDADKIKEDLVEQIIDDKDIKTNDVAEEQKEEIEPETKEEAQISADRGFDESTTIIKKD